MLKDECIDKCLQEEMIKDKYIGELPQKEINSISDYISNISFLIEKRKNTRTTFVYRGEPRKFDQYCTPNIFRKNILSTNEFYEKSLLNALRQNKLSERSNYLENAIDAQHGEFPSRLLDVTYNCLIALYFAVTPFYKQNVTNSDDEDGMVYIFYIEDIFSPTAQNIIENYDAVINKDQKWFNSMIFEKNHKFIDHTKINNRIIAQQGAFILFQGDDAERIPTYMMNGIVIPKESKPRLREELSLMFGINTGTIYPEIVNRVDDIINQSQKIVANNFDYKNEVRYVLKKFEKELEYYYDYLRFINDISYESFYYDAVCYVEKIINSYRIGLCELFESLDDLFKLDNEEYRKKELFKAEIIKKYNDLVDEFKKELSRIDRITELSNLEIKGE